MSFDQSDNTKAIQELEDELLPLVVKARDVDYGDHVVRHVNRHRGT